MKVEIELSTCCDATVTGSYPTCTKCGDACTTYLTMEEFYDEIGADDGRYEAGFTGDEGKIFPFMSDEEIKDSVNKLP